MSLGPIDPQTLLLDLVRGQAAQGERLQAIASRLDSQAGDLVRLGERKDETHRAIYDRLDSLEATRDKLLGLAVGIGIGAGAVGGGVGALVSSFLS